MKRITRTGNIDTSSATTIYAVPAGKTAFITVLRIQVGVNNGKITITHNIHSGGTTAYSMDLLSSDQFSDDEAFTLAGEDTLTIQSDTSDMSYYVFIDIS